MTQRYLLAISGGIDSVVLLDMATKWPQVELMVAHFDHGIREESAQDARFVKSLAKAYKLPFVSERAELGVGASEERARVARYAFLQRMAHEHEARLVTAHHSDDVIETMIINLLRGTGWRGLCSLRSGDILRPLLEMSKKEIISYAETHSLEWREDSTNTDTTYLRNYIRLLVVPKLGEEGKRQFLSLYKAQCQLYEAISHEAGQLLNEYRGQVLHAYRRHLFITADNLSAQELLRAAISLATGKGTMRPQLARALLAVKTFAPGTRFQLGWGIELHFSRTNVIVEDARN